MKIFREYKIHSLYAEGHSEYRDDVLWAPDSGTRQSHTRALYPGSLCRLPDGHSLSSHLENQSDGDRLHCVCIPSILILLNNGLKVQGAGRLRFPSVSQRRPFLVYYFCVGFPDLNIVVLFHTHKKKYAEERPFRFQYHSVPHPYAVPAIRKRRGASPGVATVHYHAYNPQER